VDSGAGATGGKPSGGQDGQDSGGAHTGAAGAASSGNESGGAAVGGGGPSGAGGTGTSGEPSVAGITVSNGYGRGYGFQGYWETFVYEEAVISPTCPSPCFADSGGAVCVQGTVGPSTMAQGMLTWNLDESVDRASGLGTVDLSNTRTLTIGVQQGAGHGSSLWAGVYSDTANGTACARISAGTSVLRLRDLVTNCALGIGGDRLTDLRRVMWVSVIASSEDGTVTPFDFCITHVSFE
jgi:hypothetical protein